MLDSKVFYNLSYGLYVLTAMDEDRPTGCIVNSVIQVTSNPSIVAVSLNHDNYTNPAIKKSKKLGITILTEDTPFEIIGTFGFKTGKDVNKFENYEYDMIANVPIPKFGCGYFVGDVIGEFETHSHTVFFVDISDGANKATNSRPMTYAYYHEVKKGNTPKNAPTHQPTKENDTSKDEQWVCSICGYIYDGDTPFEELPDSYECPICGAAKELFEKK